MRADEKLADESHVVRRFHRDFLELPLRFVRPHSINKQMGMHETQRKPDEVATEATEYMHLVRQLLVGPHRDKRFVLNMDQTPVYFSMSRKRTLEVVGVNTVHIRTSTNDTKRATVAATIAADRTVLPSMVVFKGQPNGQIVRTEFATYPTTHHYRCQKNAWMDERVMIV